jgi:hypothetical protein
LVDQANTKKRLHFNGNFAFAIFVGITNKMSIFENPKYRFWSQWPKKAIYNRPSVNTRLLKLSTTSRIVTACNRHKTESQMVTIMTVTKQYLRYFGRRQNIYYSNKQKLYINSGKNFASDRSIRILFQNKKGLGSSQSIEYENLLWLQKKLFLENMV